MCVAAAALDAWLRALDRRLIVAARLLRRLHGQACFCKPPPQTAFISIGTPEDVGPLHPSHGSALFQNHDSREKLHAKELR